MLKKILAAIALTTAETLFRNCFTWLKIKLIKISNKKLTKFLYP